MTSDSGSAPPTFADSSRSSAISDRSSSREIQPRAVIVICQEVGADSKRHRTILGGDAYRQIRARIEAFQSGSDLGGNLAFSGGDPDVGSGVL